MTQKVLEQFKSITKTACAVYVSDIINEKLKTVLQVDTLPEAVQEKSTLVGTEATETDDKIITTPEEMMGHMMVKSILAEVIDTKRIVMRDAQSYCAILLDDNNRKPICRFHFNTKKLSVGIAGAEKSFTRHDIAELEGLFGLKEQLLVAVKNYLE
ncbi:hypothetical protein [Mucilaginibacter lacusdianchii]|uniref:hypothetical protein n=1 Tax=Mucilaginibacter lacusdianchii TaxID=2684211 RepID=UPI0018EF1133|nr:hypothetical protein [Mucilaginibacter sp. JXJ CY 39]